MNNSLIAEKRIDKYSMLPGMEFLVDICVYLTLFSNFFILLGNPLRNNTLVSFGTRILIITIILLAVLVFVFSFKRTRVDMVNAWYVALIVSSFMAALTSCLTGIFNVIVQYVCFIMLPSYAVIFRNARNTKRLKNIIYIANILYCYIYIYFYFSDKSHIYYGVYGERILDELTLGYRNPNEAGMYLMLSFVVIFSYAIKSSNILFKVLNLALSAFLIVMIWQTNSRTCFILSALLVLFAFFKLINKVNKNFVNIVFLMPLAFAVLTMAFPEFFENLMIFGESASIGRTLIYKKYMNELNLKEFFFGNFLKYPGSNLHNSYISVVAMFGFPVFLIFIKYLRTIVFEYKNRILDSQNHVAFFGILMVILHGIAEGTLMVSGSVYAGIAGILFILMLPDNEEKKA